ncbi:MAG: FAD-dependent oxidoreductase, partial [Thermoguttaceae bacterium]
MKKTLQTLCLALFTVCASWFGTQQAVAEIVVGSYDVVVYGGTSAAITAAVQAAKMGKHVVLVSPDKHLGGLSSGGL